MKTQISKINALFLNYTKMLQVWNTTEFVFLSDDCVGFKVSTPINKGTVIITWLDNTILFSSGTWSSRSWVSPNAEEVLDDVKDYVENGDV